MPDTAASTRTRTVGPFVVVTGPADPDLFGVYVDREADRSWSVEMHGIRRFLGVYR